MSGRLRGLKNKEKVQWGNPTSGRGRLRELFITNLSQIFNAVFTKAVVTRASRLREWSQEQPRLWGWGCFYTSRLQGLTPHY